MTLNRVTHSIAAAPEAVAVRVAVRDTHGERGGIHHFLHLGVQPAEQLLGAAIEQVVLGGEFSVEVPLAQIRPLGYNV
ncbi:hypothetical protein BHQ23_05480 [Mycobacterium gordonae]|uniref:Uncharacterized protein n=1 Tax=Mycobacterium gordonae TaxID=1778 RepID=A0A1X1WF75_MYCGO|nr:hypothetical protein BHQ23_05480 [Mycobacterium gordonae]ORV85170.1 hypothetical protein AWC08_25740 [Mycobacterium gordonae]